MNTKRIKVHVFEIVDASRCLETSDRGNVWIKSKTRDVSAVTRSSISDLGGLYIYIFYFYIFTILDGKFRGLENIIFPRVCTVFHQFYLYFI